MRVLLRVLILASCGTSCLLLYFSLGFGVAYSIGSHMIAAAFLFPWTLGVFGVVGLLRCWPDAATKSELRLRQDVALLSLGIAGAVIFAALMIFVLRFRSLAVIALFCVTPITVASFEIRKALVAMRDKPLLNAVKMRNFYTALILLCVGLVSGRILSEELVLLWYGYDLVPAAYSAAAKISEGKPYCVRAPNGAGTFAELDKRTILLDAIKKRLGVIGREAGRDPHFGIVVVGQVYWWSFRQKEFKQLLGIPGPFPTLELHCPPAGP